MNDDFTSPALPPREIPHYHGDAVRALLVVAAILIVIGVFMLGASSLGSVTAAVMAVVLVVAAGITNPAQLWIHWVDAALAALGALFFGSTALGSYRAGGVVSDPMAFVFTLALAIVSLVALYLATKTIRGMMLREF
jgi:hypothetical protein